MITIKINDNKLRATIRGQSTRPAQRHTDRRKEAKNKACRGPWRGE
jgi:hypothetical protein